MLLILTLILYSYNMGAAATKDASIKPAKPTKLTSKWRKYGSALTLNRDDKLIVQIMMPLYYTEEPVRFQDVYTAKISWDKIIKNESLEFDIQKSNLPYNNCREWFEALFYKRLFDVHPFSKKMFKDPSVQGKFLVSFFLFVFTVLDDEDKFQARLVDLAESHCKRGVKSSEYAFIGEVMFWTLRRCIGSAYDSDTHQSWVKIFSKMLKVIVPISVAYELRDNETQLARIDKFNNSNTPSTTNQSAAQAKAVCPFMPLEDPLDEKVASKITVKGLSSSKSCATDLESNLSSPNPVSKQ